jgi:hypothetical protein
MSISHRAKSKDMPDAGPLRPCATWFQSSGIPQQTASKVLASCIVARDVDENLNLNLKENGARKRASAAFVRKNYCDGSGVTLPSFADRFSTQIQVCFLFVE